MNNVQNLQIMRSYKTDIIELRCEKIWITFLRDKRDGEEHMEDGIALKYSQAENVKYENELFHSRS